METVVCILTYNAMANFRVELLERTCNSIDRAFPSAAKIIFDNGSTDGTEHWCVERAVAADWSYVCIPVGNNTPGAGRNAVLRTVLGDQPFREPKLIVFSDDDMEWKEGAEETLVKFWSHDRRHATDILILSGLLEPLYHWNTPRELIEVDGVKVLVRDSAPAAAWSFVVGGIEHGIGPHHFACERGGEFHGRKTVFIEDFGEDYEYCQRTLESSLGFKVAQIDLADHIGWGYSTHGNDADQHVDGRPLDREKWGI